MDLTKLNREFFTRDVLEVAPELIGKKIVRFLPSGNISEHIITETEAYRGMEDKACHACRGRTPRTSVMFAEGGILYMYLIYGIHWMMNIVTSLKDEPQAVLIRGIEDAPGPGRVTRKLGLDGSFNREDIVNSGRVQIFESGIVPHYTSYPRVGIDYAGSYWKNKPWRFVLQEM
ncbi:MAG: DNA-3-methyladenine glycosylase [Bacteroidales bacterium]|nr:DNA-3-methyladenine glycosylase [Bacteroidales bacterium]